ncbi:MAG TPA: SURF1 family protein [Casimicrobiaceae bacterium]|nr:SURF1 family protein [Casimicrobiaceae bacterium]
MSVRTWRRPSGFAIGLTALGMTAFGALGVWQLDRADQKRQLLAAFAGAAQAPLEELAAVRAGVDATRYPHVRVGGRYVDRRGYLLDEQVHAGQVGVHAIGVFAPAGGDDLLLVDRGWVAWNHAPGTTPALPALVEGETMLTGIYAPYPGGGLRLGNQLQRQATWPKLTLYLDDAQIGADLGHRLLPRMLLLDPAADSGFVREWKPALLPPERHLAYAVQWFALALAAAVIFIVLHWRKLEADRG